MSASDAFHNCAADEPNIVTNAPLCGVLVHRAVLMHCPGVVDHRDRTHMGGSQKRCTMWGDRVRDCITQLLSIKSLNVDDFHVSVAINI